MKKILGMAVISAMLLSNALADFAEGKITKLDPDNLTIVLDDGNSYKLPSEFNLEGVTVDMTALIAYEIVDGEKLVTDMELME